MRNITIFFLCCYIEGMGVSGNEKKCGYIKFYRKKLLVLNCIIFLGVEHNSLQTHYKCETLKDL